jgi:hypothetical protein
LESQKWLEERETEEMLNKSQQFVKFGKISKPKDHNKQQREKSKT